MGVLSTCYKSKFLDLLKFLNNFNWLIVFFSLINLSVCIYEDQIGKFDWKQTYVGRIKFAQFDTVSTAKKIIVATEENVLAALNLKTGQVVWRHVFETASTGNIQLLDVTDRIITVSGTNPYLVRGWESTTGVLLWEWSLTLQNNNRAEFSEWWVQNDLLVHMLPVFGSHIEVSMYNVQTGHNRGSTSKLPAIWTNEECVTAVPYYTCMSGNTGSQLLISLDVTSNAVQIINKPLAQLVKDEFVGSLRPLDANSIQPGFVLGDKRIVVIKNNEFVVTNVNLKDPSASVTIVEMVYGPAIVQIWSDASGSFSMVAHRLANGKEVGEIRGSGSKVLIPEPKLASVACSRDAPAACRLLVTAADEAAHFLQQGGRIIWTREEALANIVLTEFVDLPVSDLEAAIESEFDQKEGSVWAAFARRLATQLHQLQTFLLSFRSAGGLSQQDGSHAPLVRDYFNLHKILVLVTEVGKIFGMDNMSGEIVWHRFEPRLSVAGGGVFTRRSARHPPLDALLTVVGKDEETGNGLIISLNPLRGTLVGEKRLSLDVQLLQCTMLHQADNEKLHALVLLDAEENVQVLPASAAPLVENMFLYVAERSTGKMQGYALKYDGKEVLAEKTWSLRLGGAEGTHRIVSLTRAPAGDRAHSPGRVLPDRGVLYKHSNRNLLLAVTQGADPLHRDVVTAWCVDGASGAVVCAQAQRRARATPLAARADHMFAYLYYSDKQRRYEIATMELYEGNERWDSEGTGTSSLGPARGAPLVWRATHVLPATPLAATFTRTQRALPDTHLLLGLSTGSIVEVPWAHVEPRPEGEGLPEVPLPADAALNYNRTLEGLRGLAAGPSGLESTCLLLATGLDLFYTRVAPSKTFDLLREDFDYYLLLIVLAALVVATYSTKYFASRKMLKTAWKR